MISQVVFMLEYWGRCQNFCLFELFYIIKINFLQRAILTLFGPKNPKFWHKKPQKGGWSAPIFMPNELDLSFTERKVCTKFEVNRTKIAISRAPTHNYIYKYIHIYIYKLFNEPPKRVQGVKLWTSMVVPGLSLAMRVMLIAIFPMEIR